MRKLILLITNIIYIPIRIFSKVSPFTLIRNCKISKKSSVKGGTRIYSSTFNDYSYIGRNCLVTETDVGKYCSIADYCCIGLASHPTSWVSTSPVFHAGINILKTNYSDNKYNPIKRTIIDNDVWIGMNVCIIAGVHIGTGAVVGAGAIVTKDVEPYSIIGGNPARLIRKRFDDDIIDGLLKLEWWDWSDEILKERAKYFNNPEELFAYIQNKKF